MCPGTFRVPGALEFRSLGVMESVGERVPGFSSEAGDFGADEEDVC